MSTSRTQLRWICLSAPRRPTSQRGLTRRTSGELPQSIATRGPLLRGSRLVPRQPCLSPCRPPPSHTSSFLRSPVLSVLLSLSVLRVELLYILTEKSYSFVHWACSMYSQTPVLSPSYPYPEPDSRALAWIPESFGARSRTATAPPSSSSEYGSISYYADADTIAPSLFLDQSWDIMPRSISSASSLSTQDKDTLLHFVHDADLTSPFGAWLKDPIASLSSSTTFSFEESEVESWRQSPPLPDALLGASQGKSRVCDRCGKCFGWPSQLRKHQKIHDQSNRAHRCTQCDMSFLYRKDLKRHQNTKHRLSGSPSEIFRCRVAGCQLKKEFTRRDKRREHEEKQHSSQSSSQDSCDLSEDIMNYSDANASPRSPCSSPRSMTAEPTSYLKTTTPTMQQNSNAKPFACPFRGQGCDRTDSFNSYVDLARHLRSVHNFLLPADSHGFYKCAYQGCKNSSKLYPRKDNFKRHVVTIHPNVETDDLVERSILRNPKLSSQDLPWSLPLIAFDTFQSLDESGSVLSSFDIST